MEFSTLDFGDAGTCYRTLMTLLHPTGLACPKCGARHRIGVHRRSREPLLDYQCGACRRVFNAYTGTILAKCHLSPSVILRLVRAILDRQSMADVAREVPLAKSTLFRWRGRLLHSLSEQLPGIRMGQGDAAREKKSTRIDERHGWR